MSIWPLLLFFYFTNLFCLFGLHDILPSQILNILNISYYFNVVCINLLTYDKFSTYLLWRNWFCLTAYMTLFTNIKFMNWYILSLLLVVLSSFTFRCEIHHITWYFLVTFCQHDTSGIPPRLSHITTLTFIMHTFHVF